MRIRTKLLGVATLALGASLAVAPLTASAQDVHVLVFSGLAGNISPNIGLTPVLSGTYNFGGSCTAAVDVEVGVPATGGCTIGSTGSFISVTCGTGLATGTSTVTEGDGDVHNTSYNILFVGGVGLLAGTDSSNEGSPGVAVGVVDILPAAGPTACVTGVSAFSVNGVVVDADA